MLVVFHLVSPQSSTKFKFPFQFAVGGGGQHALIAFILEDFEWLCEDEKQAYRRYRIILGILFPKLFWPTVRENCSVDQEKLLKF